MMEEEKGNVKGVESIDPFSWSVQLRVDDETDQFLNRPQENSKEEEQFPREVIADALGATRFQAELSRPLLLGSLRGLDAYLLRTRFSFGRVTTNWLSRIQAADITIVFEDATGAKQHPAVAAFYPELFEGEASEALVTDKVGASLDASYMGAGAGLTREQSTMRLKKGKVIVHGIRGGGRARNAITWSIEEDQVSKEGIPRTVELPLVITRQSEARFSARVTVKAHYGFWRGVLARGFPVLGKNDAPLFFDPVALRSMAMAGTSEGPDGGLVVEQAGAFDEIDLSIYSTFKALRK